MGATANYIDSKWEYKSTHLTLKLVGWRHFGVLLARPIGRFLIRHSLHRKISVISFFVVFSSHLDDFGTNYVLQLSLLLTC